jgi:hypothetical protein
MMKLLTMYNLIYANKKECKLKKKVTLLKNHLLVQNLLEPKSGSRWHTCTF